METERERTGRRALPGGRVFLAFLVLVLALGARAARAEEESRAVETGPVLTLAEAVDLALLGNPQVLTARMKVEQNEADAAAARAQMLPLVQFEGSHDTIFTPLEFRVDQGALGTFPIIGPIPAQDQPIATISGSRTSYKFSVTQPLTTLVKLGYNKAIKEEGTEAARGDLRDQEANTVLQVRQSYFDLLEARRGLEAAEAAVLMQREMERVTRDEVEQGKALPASLVQARSSLLQAESQALTLAVNLANGKEQMNLLLGRDPATPFRLEEPQFPPPPSLESSEAYVEEALRQRPDLAAQEATLRQAEAAEALARADWIPDVQAELSYQKVGNSGLLPGELWMLSLQAQYDLVDWGERIYDVEAQESQTAQAREGVKALRDQIKAQVRSQIRTLEGLTLALEAARASREAAAEQLRVVANQMSVGMAMAENVLQAQAQLSQAIATESQALGNLASGWAQFEQILGRVR